MFSTVISATLLGLQVEEVRVEVDTSNGLPLFHMVGYLSSEVKESAERVRTAIRNAQITLPPKRVVINLAPAGVRKTGSSFDLPIAVGVLASMGMFQISRLTDTMMLGELGLDGKVKGVPGILPITKYAIERGMKRIIVPKENVKEASMMKGVEVIGIAHLKELCYALENGTLPQASPFMENIWEECLKKEEKSKNTQVDFSDIVGQESVKRACEIAVAGYHNFLMVGPPGAGKTMVAERMPGIFPPLTFEESLDISHVYSVLGILTEKEPLVLHRPFRRVHHTATKAALMGGGSVPKPGEISLAGKGILFLDELTEFKREVLEVLRQPLEEHKIHISRTRGNYDYPADFMLVAAMNPCPCGYYPDLNKCSCTIAEVKQYLNKISQPLLDRIDICIETPQLTYKELDSPRQEKGKSTKEMRSKVMVARQIQKERFSGREMNCNSRLNVKELEEFCALSTSCRTIVESAYERLHLTARSYHKTLKVARTIADLEESANIMERHLMEALGYRGMNKDNQGGHQS